jgi:hypothetical protein
MILSILIIFPAIHHRQISPIRRLIGVALSNLILSILFSVIPTIGDVLTCSFCGQIKGHNGFADHSAGVACLQMIPQLVAGAIIIGGWMKAKNIVVYNLTLILRPFVS